MPERFHKLGQNIITPRHIVNNLVSIISYLVSYKLRIVSIRNNFLLDCFFVLHDARHCVLYDVVRTFLSESAFFFYIYIKIP